MLNFSKTKPEILDMDCTKDPASPRHLSIVLPTFNEEENVAELFTRLDAALSEFSRYRFTFLFIDNASQDGTVDRLRHIARIDPRVRIIVNARNFGHVRSPTHAFFLAEGDAVIVMATDLQDPPELIGEFIKKWESGFSVCVGVKETSDEPVFLRIPRTIFYRLINSISETPVLEHATGFGLYDRRVVEIMRGMAMHYSFLRGAIAEIGLPTATISFRQPVRRRGSTKNSLAALFDFSLVAMTVQSRLPMRLAIFIGGLIGGVSICIAVAYLVFKLLYWDRFPAGVAPALIGMFFLSGVHLFFLGILGEYVSANLLLVSSRPFVVEKERINFD